MLSFFSRPKPSFTDFSGLGTDMHSHLLPGIDDGSPDAETSIQLIKGLLELGYKKFITTPHIMMDLYKNTPVTIAAAHRVLKEALLAEKIEVDIHAAAEYLMDENFEKLLHTKAPLLTLKDNFVLVEFSFVSAPINLQEILFQIQINGYRPVLAHPERYAYLQRSKEVYDELKNAGCLFQLNLLALTSYYGKDAMELASYLLGKDYYDLLGTDLHHDRHLAGLMQYGTPLKTILRLIDRGRVLNTTW